MNAAVESSAEISADVEDIAFALLAAAGSVRSAADVIRYHGGKDFAEYLEQRAEHFEQKARKFIRGMRGVTLEAVRHV